MPNTQGQSNAVSAKKETVFKKFLWLRRNFFYCMSIFALAWIVGICYYIEHFIGWAGITALAPADFGLFILSTTAPLFLGWFILAYIERSSSLDTNTELFYTYINSLMYPDEDASHNAKAFSAALQKQVNSLQKESKAVIEQSALLKKDLDARVADLTNILELMDNYSAKTLATLNDSVKSLADRCSYVTDKTTNAAQNMRECSADIALNSDKFLSKLTPLLDEISAVSSNIKSSITDNKANLAEIKQQLGDCVTLSREHVENMLVKTNESAFKIEQSFAKTIEEYDMFYKRLDASVSSVESRVEEQKRLLGAQTQVLNHNSELISNKLSKYGKTVSAEIDKLVKSSVELEKMTKRQIAALKAVNTETGKAVHGIGAVFDEKRQDIERRCEYAISSMQNVIIAINKETDKLLSFTNLTQAKNLDLQNITETMVEKIGDISNKLALKTDTLKDKAVEVIDKFTEASSLITKSTDKINKSSDLIVSNGKIGSKLMEEQNFYITNTLSNMDLAKDKLDKLHIDIKTISEEIAKTLASYDEQSQRLINLKSSNTESNSLSTSPEQEKLLNMAKGIGRFLQNINIRPEKVYEGLDLFDLWDSYLDGQHGAFNEVLSHRLTRKQIMVVRKAFDDNADFHNLVIEYLFLMDNLIKDMTNPLSSNRDELVNFAVNASAEKMYFILIKALNNAE